jgi:hypothetical protein
MARWMNRMPAGTPSWRDVRVDSGAHWGYASKCISGRREQAMKDLTVTLENRPGSLADLGAATGSAGINIEGVCGSTEGGQAAIHILVDDAAGTRAALREAGIEVSGERDVLVVDIENRPGAMGEVARRIGDAGANIELVYTTFGAVRLVLGVDDVDKARAAL